MDVLVIDDDKNIRTTLALALESLGCNVVQAADGKSALSSLERKARQLAFLDLRLGTASGLDLLPQLLQRAPGLRVVLVTAYLDIPSALEALRRGAWEILEKPFSPEQIRVLVERVRALQPKPVDAPIETESPAMRSLLDTLERAAPHDAPIFLVGEPGSGTTQLAHRAHALSGRAALTVIHCPTQSPAEVEAFRGGTLLLDEVGELHPSLQSRLSRVLAEEEVRVIATSHRDLRDVAGFRQDLLFQINTVELLVPPLRDRKEDILPLARRFLAAQTRVHTLSSEAEQALVGYRWPGNLRELKSAIERAAILSAGARIELESLPPSIVQHTRRAPYLGGDFTLDEIEREHLLAVIERHERLDEAAQILGIDASTLWRKRKKLET
jgi:NtrC-family two-component system response regulator AlgB